MTGVTLTCCFLSLRLEPGRSELQLHHSQSDMRTEQGSEALSKYRGEDAQLRHQNCRRSGERVLHIDRCDHIPKGASSDRSECVAGGLVLR